METKNGYLSKTCKLVVLVPISISLLIQIIIVFQNLYVLNIFHMQISIYTL